MRTGIKWIAALVMLTTAGVAAYRPAMNYWKKRNQPEYRTVEVSKGDVVYSVNSTGVINPVRSVHIGSFVSGPIVALHKDFNDQVQQDEILAKIDSRIYDANVARDRATLATQKAEVTRVEALLLQARNNESRARALREENEDFLSDTELDQVVSSRQSLEAQLEVAKAMVQQAEASLNNSMANLEYTDIRSPVDGVVIDRKIDPGQTLAATFQTPELFIVAPDMEKEMHIHASVDEADIGLIRQAQQRQQLVEFTVDAYSDDLFHGHIHQVRLSSTKTQNVVTYPVIVSAANPDLKLLPGMTANLSFQVEERKDVLKIPNAALRFYPEVAQVRKEDHKLLEGGRGRTDEDEQMQETRLSAKEKVEASRSRTKRHVWVEENGLLRAIEVETGISDNRNTELIAGDLKVGQKLVTGVKPKTP